MMCYCIQFLFSLCL